MKTCTSRTTKSDSSSKAEESLPHHANFVSEPGRDSFEVRRSDWKAGTLPAELLPQNRIYFGRWSLPFCEKSGQRACRTASAAVLTFT
jgi:hypothetical protein